jgi:fructose-1,6-bisphosphatase/inositol monophosphatase family enzyme
MVTVDAFLLLARQLVRQAYPTICAAVAAESRAPDTKVDGSFVTETDRFVEDLFTQEFEKAFPAIPVIGEEAAADAHHESGTDARQYYAKILSAAQQIIMDPIDGTKNFVEGRPEFCVAIALTKRLGNGIWPEAGLVAIPVAGKMYWCNQEGVFEEDIESGDVVKVCREPRGEIEISVNSRDRGWLREHHYRIKHPWVSCGSSVHDFLGTVLGQLQGSLVCAQRLWDLMAPLALADRLGCGLRDFSTGERVVTITQADLSLDLVQRPWGLTRRMMLLPNDSTVEDLISS